LVQFGAISMQIAFFAVMSFMIFTIGYSQFGYSVEIRMIFVCVIFFGLIYSNVQRCIQYLT
jgi:hypothetical protein